MFLDPGGGGALDLKTTISISNGIPTLTVQISMKTDPYSALDKPQKHTLQTNLEKISMSRLLEFLWVA